MRITNNQFYVTVLQNIRRPTGQLLSLQEKLSSGKRINRYADDPAGAALAENYKGTRAKTVQFKRNIDDALGWMQQTEGVLNQLESNLIRAKSLAVQAANGSNSARERKTIASEIDQILEDVLAVANSQYRGKYLFAGLNTLGRPYVEIRDSDGLIEKVTLSDADTGEIEREVSDGVRIQMNIPGNDIFNLSDGPLTTLIALRDDLNANDVEGIKDGLDALDAALELSLDARTENGARVNRLETTRTYLETREIDITSLISDLEDANYDELVIKLSQNEVAYRAALGSVANLSRTSLVDLLT